MIHFLKWADSNLGLLLITVCIALDCLWFYTVRDRLPMGKLKTILIAALLNGFVLLGAAVLAVIEFRDFNAVSSVRIYGAIFVAPLAIYAVAKKSEWNIRDAFDCLTICLAFGLMIIRIECLRSGCCLGTKIFGLNDVRWPLRELEMALFAAFTVRYISKIRKRKTSGEVFPIFLMTYGVFRFIAEWFRAEFVALGPIHMAHLWSLIAICVGASVYFSLREQQQKKQSHTRR